MIQSVTNCVFTPFVAVMVSRFSQKWLNVFVFFTPHPVGSSPQDGSRLLATAVDSAANKIFFQPGFKSVLIRSEHF
ncbi:hypothetical protein FH5T_21665 [Draconibacterium orientale]|uniref:Secreted protein n=1 Tax=Draconibacterium orientale TaxID=1168034 RepID=A0ABM5QEX7_9BACT|nr:hypothetical protein FH5T_21665 [Draconibacterium orientale]